MWANSSLVSRTLESSVLDEGSGRNSSFLLRLLDQQWRERAEKIAFRYLSMTGDELAVLTYSELSRRALALAETLIGAGCAGQPVLLLYPDGLDFVVGMVAALYASAIAVPLPLPRDSNAARRVALCAADCGAKVAVTSRAARDDLKSRLDGNDAALIWMTEDDVPSGAGAGPRAPVADDCVALLQYTSGSTGDPKGVMITHDNLSANAGVIAAAFGHRSSLVGVGWLPLSHDMGLMGHVLQPLVVGGESILMSPAAFIRRPRRWLEAISKYRASTSGGPCFAFELACRRISESELQGLDLTSWTLAYCGAEPINAGVLQRFSDRFAPVGFAAESLYPCYGLAESTLFVTGAQRGVGFHAEPPAVSSQASLAGASSGRVLVNCGRPWFDHEVRVVDPDTLREVPPGSTGEIWVRGPSVAKGYWNRAEESERCFRARIVGDPGASTYLRTGDLGHISQGDLFVSGRLKDVLILNGKNRHAEDIEATVQQSAPALLSRPAVAFACERAGSEVAVLVQELQRALPPGEADALKKRIQASLLSAYGFTASDIVFVPSGAIPRTTSGKVRRRDCRRLYETRALASFNSASGEESPSAGL